MNCQRSAAWGSFNDVEKHHQDHWELHDKSWLVNGKATEKVLKKVFKPYWGDAHFWKCSGRHISSIIQELGAFLTDPISHDIATVTPYRMIASQGGLHSPKSCDTPLGTWCHTGTSMRYTLLQHLAR